MKPVHEDYDELASRIFYSFDEQRSIWASGVRKLRTGTCLMRLVDDDKLYEVDVKRSVPGHLAWDWETITERYPKAIEERDALIEANFRSDLFVRPEVIERELQRRIECVVKPPITLESHDSRPSDVSRFD